MASIRELGLLNPIVLTQDHRLVAGLHRLRACEALGWKEIPAVVLALSTLDAELAEIDENLCRAELTVLERCVQTLRRKVIYEEKHPETRQGLLGAAASNRKQGKKTQPSRVTVASFTQDTEERTGAKERSIERSIQIAEGVSPEVCALIADTPLADRQGELIILARISDPKKQAAVAKQVVTGQPRPPRG